MKTTAMCPKHGMEPPTQRKKQSYLLLARGRRLLPFFRPGISPIGVAPRQRCVQREVGLKHRALDVSQFLLEASGREVDDLFYWDRGLDVWTCRRSCCWKMLQAAS